MKNCLFCYKDSLQGDYHSACVKKFFDTTELSTLQLCDALIKSLAEKNINQRIALTDMQPKLSISLQKQKGHNCLTIVGL